MEGIDNLQKVLKGLSGVVSASSQLLHVDWKASMKEVVDLDDAEAAKLAEDLKALDLVNDELEAKIEVIGGVVAKNAVLFLRLLKLFVLK